MPKPILTGKEFVLARRLCEEFTAANPGVRDLTNIDTFTKAKFLMSIGFEQFDLIRRAKNTGAKWAE